MNSSRNDPCPCGSGKKYKACCYRKNRESELERLPSAAPVSYPIGTVATYGPDDKTTTKIAAGVIRRENAEPIIERWVGTNIMEDALVQQQLMEFFRRHYVKQVATCDGNMGCPHEEGEDFPHGEDCPFCPFWKGKQGSRQRA